MAKAIFLSRNTSFAPNAPLVSSQAGNHRTASQPPSVTLVLHTFNTHIYRFILEIGTPKIDWLLLQCIPIDLDLCFCCKTLYWKLSLFELAMYIPMFKDCGLKMLTN